LLDPSRGPLDLHALPAFNLAELSGACSKYMFTRATFTAGISIRERALTSLVAILLWSTVLRADYSTNFDLTENPISEGGIWTNGGTDGQGWKDVRTASGYAFGTQTGTDTYLDSTAILKGSWAADQSVSGVVHTVNENSSVFEEVECRLRSTIIAHSNT
jgi:hypothetical protein